MCKAWEDHKNIGVMEGREAGRIDSLCIFLQNGGTDESAKKMLNVSDDDIKTAREIIKRKA